jgi:hypothetical protein
MRVALKGLSLLRTYGWVAVVGWHGWWRDCVKGRCLGWLDFSGVLALGFGGLRGHEIIFDISVVIVFCDRLLFGL